VAPPGFELATGGARLIGALNAAIGARTELSVLNRLVVGAGLSWREVNLLHAYCAYRLAVEGPRAAERADLMANALVAFPAVAAAAVGLFRALFGPGDADAERARTDLLGALAGVPDLRHDEALRELVALVEATTRTNWALDRETISLKFASSSIPFLPPPVPLAEMSCGPRRSTGSICASAWWPGEAYAGATGVQTCGERYWAWLGPR
jgi:glutamate dehydrogenase